jgi:CheY-like chemotaxis protein
MASQPVDLIISDIAMPGMDGYTFIRKMREKEQKGRRLPAIALTAFTRPEDRQRALLAGFDSYVAKPVDANELLTVAYNLRKPANA